MPKRNKHNKSLDSLETLAHGRETRWQRHVSSQLSSLQKEEQRLQQLHKYVEEYNAPLHARGSHSIMAMRTQRQFVDRLKAAVKQQNQTVADKRDAAERGLQRWKLERSKRLAIQKYSERQRLSEQKLRERRDQAGLDEVGRNGFLQQRKEG